MVKGVLVCAWVMGQGLAIPPQCPLSAPPGTHVMAAVSARKAWAVTSHLMFFTATFCPMYSPSRTSGRGHGACVMGLSPWPHIPLPTSQAETPKAPGQCPGRTLGDVLQGSLSPSPHLPPNSPCPMRSPSVRCCRFSNQPAENRRKDRSKRPPVGPCHLLPQNPDLILSHHPLPLASSSSADFIPVFGLGFTSLVQMAPCSFV